MIFESPIRTTHWGSIPSPDDLEPPSGEAFISRELAYEPTALNSDKLPALSPGQLKQVLVWEDLGYDIARHVDSSEHKFELGPAPV